MACSSLAVCADGLSVVIRASNGDTSNVAHAAVSIGGSDGIVFLKQILALMMMLASTKASGSDAEVFIYSVWKTTLIYIFAVGY